MYSSKYIENMKIDLKKVDIVAVYNVVVTQRVLILQLYTFRNVIRAAMFVLRKL